MCRYTDLNLNKTKYHVQGLVTLWIINRHYKFKVRYPEHGYHVNFPALFKPYTLGQKGGNVIVCTHSVQSIYPRWTVRTELDILVQCVYIVQTAKQLEIFLQCVHSQDISWTHFYSVCTVSKELEILLYYLKSDHSSQKYFQSMYTVRIVVVHTLQCLHSQ